MPKKTPGICALTEAVPEARTLQALRFGPLLAALAVTALALPSGLSAKENHGRCSKEVPVYADLLIFTGGVIDPTDPVLRQNLDRIKAARNPNGCPSAAGVVIPVLSGTVADYNLAGIRNLMDAYGLRRHGITITFPDRDISSSDPAVRAAGEAFLKSRIDIVKAFGGKNLTGPIVVPEAVFPTDAAGVRLTGNALVDHMEQRYRNAVEPMRRVAEYAQSQGITLGHEYITHWEIPGQNTLSQAIAFALEVNHPSFGLLTDISHEVHNGRGLYLWSGLMEFAVEKGIPLFVQVSEPGRGDIRNSWLPFNEFFGVLQELHVINENSPLDVEIFDNIPGFEFLSLTRRTFADPAEIEIGGVQYSQARWQAVPGEYRKIPKGAQKAALKLLAADRKIYQTP
ncbi:MAG: sugar phosphate isomerase/epimerase family protein [Fibrobacteria bacterium]